MRDIIKITVKFHSILRHSDANIIDRLEMDIPKDSTVGSVLQMLQIPKDLDMVIAINGRSTQGDSILSDGDVLELIPAISGG